MTEYGRSTIDALCVRSIDLPDGKTGWIIDDTEWSVLDTRESFPTRRGAMVALRERRSIRFRAVCSCGWRGPVRINPNDADTFRENHVYRHPRRDHLHVAEVALVKVAR
jgi:hypothetical protein